ncbi:MAG: hypothetical protein ACM3WU_04710 [Bacillota bacterium]
MRVAPVVLNGPGRVGLEFVRLLNESASDIAAKTGITPVLRAVQSRKGILFSPHGLSLEEVRDWAKGQGQGPRSATVGLKVFAPADYASVLEMVRADSPGVVVEATPTNLETGEPGLSNVRTALEKGFSAVSLAKGPLVVAFGNLAALAKNKGACLRYSGAVAAALPTIDTAVYAMAGAGIYEIEGVLNGTTNYILNGMASGKSYKEALVEAQSMGVAEANPRLDVEGFDSAAKLLIIANTVWDLRLGLQAVARQGIPGLDAGFVHACAEKGTPVRLVARAVLAEGRADLSVRPEPVPQGHPFSNLPGTSKAVRFRSRNMGEVVVSGGASDVTGAAASALKDLIHVLEGRGIS